jgi:S1/P1 Nuclease
MRLFRLVVVIGAGCAAQLLPLCQSQAWGPEGHRTIALIADKVLQQSDAAARGKVQALLATDKDNRLTKNDIASEAIWADVLRDKSQEGRIATSNWHAVRLRADSPELAAACYGRPPLPSGYPASRGPRDNCVVDKIEQFRKELQNPDTLPGERLAALQFLLNLVGDVNDPLLAIDKGDQGGQCTAVQIGGKPPVRLSTYWQTTLVGEVVGRDPAAGAARLLASVAPGDMQSWAGGDPESWAMESYQLAKTVAYAFPADSAATKAPPGTPAAAKGAPDGCGEVALYRVGPDYETKALAAVKQQLAKAGLRLAQLLRDCFK